MEDLENFLKQWNSKQTIDRGNKKIMVFPESFANTIYGFDFRFVHLHINAEEFDRIKNRIFMISKNLFQVVSTHDEYNSGILRVAVLICNYGYNKKAVFESVKIILTDILPSIRQSHDPS